MVLQVVQVPNPPAGQDWSASVPGINEWDVTGITAQLTTATIVGGVLHDSSGNGRNGTYVAPIQVGPDVGIVTGDSGLIVTSAPTGVITANAPVTIATFAGAFYIICWLDDLGDTGATLLSLGQYTGPGGHQINLSYKNDLAGNAWQMKLQVVFGGVPTGTYTLTGAHRGGAPHMLAAVYHFAPDNCTFYDNGVAVGTAANTTGPYVAAHPTLAKTLTAGKTGMRFDEYAIGAGNPSGATIAALYGNRGSFAAYTAAQLALTPSNYYHLDDVSTTHGRTPSLVVTNGTNTLAAIPPGFPAVTTPGPYSYSWQPNLNADSQSTDGTLTTVAIPPLIVPAGYHVGTRTPDIVGTDQWSNVAVWWDDAYQNLTNPLTAYQYPPGAHLVYQQNGTP